MYIGDFGGRSCRVTWGRLDSRDGLRGEVGEIFIGVDGCEFAGEI